MEATEELTHCSLPSFSSFAMTNTANWVGTA
uniref:Uncharacterized protein n=1 Tax=Rhodopseudomonas palustris (strain DX-1) TaxID=652103 RepID=E6VEP6_RHOPX